MSRPIIKAPMFPISICTLRLICRVGPNGTLSINSSLQFSDSFHCSPLLSKAQAAMDATWRYQDRHGTDGVASPRSSTGCLADYDLNGVDDNFTCSSKYPLPGFKWCLVSHMHPVIEPELPQTIAQKSTSSCQSNGESDLGTSIWAKTKAGTALASGFSETMQNVEEHMGPLTGSGQDLDPITGDDSWGWADADQYQAPGLIEPWRRILEEDEEIRSMIG